VPERLQRVAERGAEVIDMSEVDDVAERVRELTGGRGADSVVDAVGMEAHGSPVAETAQKALRLLPKKVQGAVMTNAGVDRLAALYTAIEAVRRGGTISISGVYGGAADPLPLLQLFDKQVQVRMGQANVRAWTDDIVELLGRDEDVLGVESFATHRLPLAEAPEAYATFRDKKDGMIKVLFTP
jgi:threonine dehydrogenase-like Zn-dependent dehydrogenase